MAASEKWHRKEKCRVDKKMGHKMKELHKSSSLRTEQAHSIEEETRSLLVITHWQFLKRWL